MILITVLWGNINLSTVGDFVTPGFIYFFYKLVSWHYQRSDDRKWGEKEREKEATKVVLLAQGVVCGRPRLLYPQKSHHASEQLCLVMSTEKSFVDTNKFLRIKISNRHLSNQSSLMTFYTTLYS